jgi:hypothetical protein
MKAKMIGTAVVVILLVIAVGLNTLYVFGTAGEDTIRIKRLDHKVVKAGDSVSDEYLVFTEENGVYKNVDCILRLKFSSSDLQGSLEPGKKYKIQFYGWRIPALSHYPNIIAAQEIQEDAKQ